MKQYSRFDYIQHFILEKTYVFCILNLNFLFDFKVKVHFPSTGLSKNHVGKKSERGLTNNHIQKYLEKGLRRERGSKCQKNCPHSLWMPPLWPILKSCCAESQQIGGQKTITHPHPRKYSTMRSAGRRDFFPPDRT